MDCHLSILGVLLAQPAHGCSMDGAAMKNLCRAANQNIGEALPVFAISIDDQRGLCICLEICHSLEFCRARSLRFLVNRGIEMLSIKSKANGHDVRLAISAGGSEMGNLRDPNKPKYRR